MSRQPVPIHQRFAAAVANASRAVVLHTQQIVTLQSQSAVYSNLVPGSWENISLQAGWSNVPGAIPAQVRLITTSTVQIIGNLQGGTTTDGTVIGTLDQGFYNAVHQHNVQITVVAGAAAVNNAITQGQLMDKGGALNNPSVSLPTAQIPTTDHVVNVVSGHITLGPSGAQFQNIPPSNSGTVANSGNTTLNNDMLHNNQTTPINYNNGTLTIGTDGRLTITNVHADVTQISFHENGIPLFT